MKGKSGIPVPKLSVVLAVLNGASVGLACIVSQGNITAAIIWFAITTGVTAGVTSRLKLLQRKGAISYSKLLIRGCQSYKMQG